MSAYLLWPGQRAGFSLGVWGAGRGRMGHLSRGCGHRLAILVHPGSYPTLPYQTLV